MSNKNLSLLFTGQGSQFTEMGIDFIKKYSWVQERYSISSKILGYDLLEAQRNPSLLNLGLLNLVLLNKLSLQSD